MGSDQPCPALPHTHTPLQTNSSTRRAALRYQPQGLKRTYRAWNGGSRTVSLTLYRSVFPSKMRSAPAQGPTGLGRWGERRGCGPLHDHLTAPDAVTKANHHPDAAPSARTNKPHPRHIVQTCGLFLFLLPLSDDPRDTLHCLPLQGTHCTPHATRVCLRPRGSWTLTPPVSRGRGGAGSPSGGFTTLLTVQGEERITATGATKSLF